MTHPDPLHPAHSGDGKIDWSAYIAKAESDMARNKARIGGKVSNVSRPETEEETESEETPVENVESITQNESTKRKKKAKAATLDEDREVNKEGGDALWSMDFSVFNRRGRSS